MSDLCRRGVSDAVIISRKKIELIINFINLMLRYPLIIIFRNTRMAYP